MGAACGDLRGDADLEATADAIKGAVLSTALARRPPQVEHPDSLAEVLLGGLAVRGRRMRAFDRPDRERTTPA